MKTKECCWSENKNVKNWGKNGGGRVWQNVGSGVQILEISMDLKPSTPKTTRNFFSRLWD